MIENFFMKRAQSRGDLGFARALTIVALMLTLVRPEWPPCGSAHKGSLHPEWSQGRD